MKVGEMIAPRAAYGEALAALAAEDDRVVVLDADVATSTMTAKVRDACPRSFYQVGIAEQNMMGIAAGMSTLGLVPYACTFAVFASKRAADQVSISIAYPALNVKISGAYGGIPTGKAGATHQAVEDLAIMRAMPNMTVVAPADAVETAQAVRAARDWPGPVYLRTVRCPVPVLFGPEHRFEIGRATPLREGRDVAIVSTGMMTAKALQAAETLAAEGIAAGVLHVATLKPLDAEAVLAAARGTAGVVTVENHSVIGGLGSAVAELLCERQPGRLVRVGLPDCFGESGDDEAVFTKLRMNVEHVVAAGRGLLGARRPAGRRAGRGRGRSRS